jgi:hypothetical protein
VIREVQITAGIISIVLQIKLISGIPFVGTAAGVIHTVAERVAGR